MLLEVKEYFRVSNAKNFVKNFELEYQFEELMDCSIDEWELGTGMADSEVIGELLEQKEGLYFFQYNESGEFFDIWKLQFEHQERIVKGLVLGKVMQLYEEESNNQMRLINLWEREGKIAKGLDKLFTEIQELNGIIEEQKDEVD